MWIMTRYGFYSVVENRDDENAVLIRARAKVDLERLCDIAGGRPGFNVADIDGPDSRADYRWRLWVKRDEWKAVLADLTDDIDYDNFKNAVGKVEKKRAGVYSRVWGVMMSVQEGERKPDGSRYQRGWYESYRDDGDRLFEDEINWDEIESDLTDDKLYEEFIEGGGYEEDDGRDSAEEAA